MIVNFNIKLENKTSNGVQQYRPFCRQWDGLFIAQAVYCNEVLLHELGDVRFLSMRCPLAQPLAGLCQWFVRPICPNFVGSLVRSLSVFVLDSWRIHSRAENNYLQWTVRELFGFMLV